jgi:hypothetical protein
VIELTQEQWREIIAHPGPTVIEPQSKTAYVVVTKEEYEHAARVVRIAWMRRQGLDEEEIQESLRDEPPVSVAEEMKQMKALDHLDEISVPDAVLGRAAIKYS